MNNNPTVLEIQLSSIEHNLNFFRSKLQNSTKILAVVKASGYGSDAVCVAQYLEQKGVDYFAVAYTDEGIALRESGINTPILVLHPQVQNLDLVIKYNLEPNLYSQNILLSFLKLTDRNGIHNYPIHLKFNTGLNRLGFKASDVDFLIGSLKGQTSILVKSIFSHLMASEDENEKQFTLEQIKKFETIAASFESSFGFKPMMHMSNTSGILNYPEAHFDMVRLGLGLYGFANDSLVNSKLKNVLTLKSVVSQIHEIDKNESVGYNRGFISTHKMRTATIPLGHADGFFRSLGQGKVFVKINGLKAPVIGNVCMDMIMVDVSGINCQEGDQVIIFDTQKEVLEMASKANTISYEILTSFSSRVKRIAV
ncbi:alanine racemase [Lutimonas sp.]|uniref:alanine racemase n=1 Tax=Lutimonas sp. TaxID=1872403 RepID=UPI003C786A65